MADPHSVWTLLTEVIRSAKMADDCKDECELLATRLEGFKQPVMEIEKNSEKGNVRCKKWLTEFKGLLERARRVTNECARRTTLKFWRWKKLPARVVEISSQIEESTTWASVFLPVRCNCSQCDALAGVYHASMERISALVLLAPLLCMETSTGHHDDALLFLLRSLAEIKRCICRGTIYTSSCPVGLDVPFIDHSEALCLSRMGSFLVRDFSFCMALVQVAFYRFIVKLNVSDILKNPVGWKINKGIAEEFCKGQLFDFFERCGEGCGKSCERSCRPVLKKQFVNWGQQVVQHPYVTEYLCQLLSGSDMDLGSPWKQVLEAEPNPRPTDLELVKIDYVKDIQQGEYLGKGSFGAVHKCTWRDQDMVVKVIDLCPEYEELFEREVTNLSSVQHPNAVQIFGFGYKKEKTEGFILMELMEMDLSTLIQEMRNGGDPLSLTVFPLDITLDLLFQIVEGMCYMKEKGVIHRDIKPANILVNRLDKGRDPFDRFYHLKLADFGTSKVNEANSIFNTVRLGTPAYMAPEVMSHSSIDEETGNGGYTFKADVYSLGMVCSEILTGKKPFQHIRSRDIHPAVLAGERPDLPLDDVDPLRRLIEDCWSSNPEARPNIWQVRQRLWECRLYCISKIERPAMNWKSFHTDLQSRSQAIRSTIEYHKRLHFSRRSFTKLPEIPGNLVHFTKLNFSQFDALKELPESMGNLVWLTHLDLHSCSSLEKLPESMGNLVCLTHLDLHSCRSLEKLPESMGNLVCLTHLDLQSCSALEKLPESMGNLVRLTHLDWSCCFRLEELPESMGNLVWLTHLDLHSCSSLEKLPESMGNLVCLTHLDLHSCSSLKELLESMGNLVCLTHLELSWCRSLKELPESIGNLVCLTHLDLHSCESLEELPESMGNLVCLTHLDWSCCFRLEELPESMGNLVWLTHLDLHSCSSLEKLPESMGNLVCLTHLELSWCRSLKELPESIGNLVCLTHLDLHSCESLEELPESMGNLVRLTHLDWSCCFRLEELPESMGNLVWLTHLDLHSCSSLEKLPESMGNLVCLTHLDLRFCSSLKELPESMGNLVCLTHLDLQSCPALKKLPESMGNLVRLTHLDWSCGFRLKELPESVANLVCLTHLDLHSCSALKELPESMGNLVCLTHLDLHSCSSLKELPESMGNLVCLTHLDLHSCSSLKELPESIGNLVCLTHLDLHSCSSLKELPESIGNLVCLTHLDLSRCGSLKKLPESMANLVCLTLLDLHSCESLKELPESIGNLDLSRCGSLKKLPKRLGKVKIAGFMR